jgi:hypothetical protein
MVLRADETGEHLWPVEDAVALAALSAGDRFYAEVGAFVREMNTEHAALLEEAVRYQGFITPSPGAARRRASFAWDFPAWRTEEIPRRRPAPATATSAPRAFMLAYLASVHARVATGTVTKGAK